METMIVMMRQKLNADRVPVAVSVGLAPVVVSSTGTVAATRRFQQGQLLMESEFDFIERKTPVFQGGR